MSTPDPVSWFAQTFRTMADNIARAVMGKQQTVHYALTCLLTEGHMLIEDYPGTGKTMLAKALAATIKGSNSRIQFTPDLLPSDVTGVTIYDQRSQQFDFHPGPVFANVVLADEINRASPKTQSAMLEVMEEGSVTVDGVSHPVGRPFMVIATQNPIEHAGTYRLPEAQLDRFLIKTAIGYPDHDATVAVLADAAVRDRTRDIKPVITADVIAQMSDIADRVHVDPAILAYVSRLAEESRRHPSVKLGLSVRGCLALVRCAKTWAIASGRNFVVPDDVKALALPVMCHRILLDADAQFSGVTVEEVIAEILEAVVPPSLRAA